MLVRYGRYILLSFNVQKQITFFRTLSLVRSFWYNHESRITGFTDNVQFISWVPSTPKHIGHSRVISWFIEFERFCFKRWYCSNKELYYGRCFYISSRLENTTSVVVSYFMSCNINKWHRYIYSINFLQNFKSRVTNYSKWGIKYPFWVINAIIYSRWATCLVLLEMSKPRSESTHSKLYANHCDL